MQKFLTNYYHNIMEENVTSSVDLETLRVELSSIKPTSGLVGWADIIFGMEKKHVRRLKEKYSDIIVDKTVICLNIPDDYSYMDDDLCKLLESVVPEYL